MLPVAAVEGRLLLLAPLVSSRHAWMVIKHVQEIILNSLYILGPV